jgi:hypothetical protein
VVAQPCDLGLVAHQPDEPQARARDDRPGQRRGARGRVHRRAADAHVQAAAERPPARVDVDRDPHGRAARRRRLDEVQVRDGVDHHRDACGVLAVGQRAQRGPVRRGISDEQVACAVSGEP